VKQIQEATSDLINTILESDYYIQYHKHLRDIQKQKDLYREFNEFRKQYFTLINREDSGFDEIEALQLRYHETLMNPDVVEFMDANDRLSLVLREMYMQLADGIDMDIDFMDEL
jgi:cell fate (sporulation/competence/biofilm development) regulator YlbF (YheA/YmcA/DUF963 family)